MRNKGFLTKFRMEFRDGATVVLCEPLLYETAVPGAGMLIRVPEGFVTDFASVPRGLWNIFPPYGEYAPATVIHDFLYRCTDLDRAICDAVFLEAMEQLEVSWIKRRLMHRAVRIFGGFARRREQRAVVKF